MYLEEGFFMDEAITGFPTSIISRWVDSKLLSEETEEVFAWMRYIEIQLGKSIRNLKDLRTLKLVVDHDDTLDRQALCNATAYFALKEMNQLRYLELYTSHWHMGLTNCQFFSQECCSLLKTHLDLTVINFSPPHDEQGGS